MRRFYHCFPQPRGSSSGAIDEGLSILENIVRFGLLLTPEVKDDELLSPQSTLAGGPNPKPRFVQKRASFTIQPREDLFRKNASGTRHVDTFGPFSISLSFANGIRLGMIPTLYVPTVPPGHSSPDATMRDGRFGQELLYRLWQTRNLLCDVARIEAKAKYPSHYRIASEDYLDRYNLKGPSNDHNAQSIRKMSSRKAKEVAEFLHSDRPPAFVLAEFVEILISAFQHVGRHGERWTDQRGPLENLDQQEWRLVKLMADGLDVAELGYEISSTYKPEKRTRVHALREVLWDHGHQFNRTIPIEDCAVLFGAEGVRFIDYVDEILVPSGAEVQTVELLTRHQCVVHQRLPLQGTDHVALVLDSKAAP